MTATALVATTVRHELKTLVMHDDLIGWVQAGTKALLDASGEQRWRRGELFLLQRGTRWDVINDPSPDGHYRAVVLLPGHELVRQFADAGGPPPSSRRIATSARLAVDAGLADALQRAIRSLDAAAGVSPALQRHRVQEVLMLLAERGWHFDPGTALTWAERARRHIAQRPADDWTVDLLAAAFAVSASTLRRRLAQDGVSAGELVREVRLETALGLLHGTALSIGDIAARCGYESHSRFTAAFRARFGLAPSALRPVTPLTPAAQGLARTG